MFLYLTSTQNMYLFDFLKDEQGAFLEKTSGDFMLKDYVVHKNKSFDHFQYIIIDLNALKDDSNDDVISSLYAFKLMYNAKIILLAGNNIDLLNDVIDRANIYNIISAKTMDRIKTQFDNCVKKGITKHQAKIYVNLSFKEDEEIEYVYNPLISDKINKKTALNLKETISEMKEIEDNPDAGVDNLDTEVNSLNTEEFSKTNNMKGGTKNYTEENTDKPIDKMETNLKFTNKNIKILIAGAMPKIGTTTIAINMARYLASTGAKVSYTETDNNQFLKIIHEDFFKNIPIVQGFFTAKGVDFYFDKNIPMEGYDFNIVDLGLNLHYYEAFEEIDNIKLLYAKLKDFEANDIEGILKSLTYNNYIDKLILSEENLPKSDIEKGKLKNSLNLKDEQIYFIKPPLDLFNSSLNTEVFKSILSDYLI